ncbi:MAG: hypothetical protein HYV75_08070, partial [Opitutae bacterium]|nr:hypothetical protein [Opitutae bacterium]
MSRRHEAGFALLLTLTLLALLVVCVLALGTLARVGGLASAQGVHQLQARQNALLGLSLALGRLQKSAGPDSCTTGTGGVGGAAAGSRFRQWCGVWPADGSGNPVWLASGAGSGASPAFDPTRAVVRLVGAGSVGTEGTDKEYVEAGKESVVVPGEPAGAEVPAGNYAYWVGDEGAKVSAVIADAEVQVSPSGRSLR